jgi:hypothetical protein
MEIPVLKNEYGEPEDPLNHPENINITRDKILDELKEKETTTINNLHNARIEYERLNYELTQIRAKIEKISKLNNTKRSGGRRGIKRRKTKRRRARK